MCAYTPTYVTGDLSAIGADAVGTAGAAAVALLPLVVTGAVIYGGVKYSKKQYDKHKKSISKPKKSMVGKGWYGERQRHSLAAKGIYTGKYRR